MKFSHLHVHTQFSLLDGAAAIDKLFNKAIEAKMPAIAISDHGNMFGVFDFVREAYKHKNSDGSLKVKPIVGCEFYITQDRTRKTFSKGEKDPRHHQILLAKNKKGYENLVKLCSLGYTEGLYSKYPRIDKSLIHKYHEGLIATTCCLGALVPQTILKKGEEEGENEFKWWLNIFQEDYYVELQRHGMPEQDRVNEILLKFSKKYNVKVIASNDSHYVEREDFNAHDILLCVNTGELQKTPALREFTDDDVNTKGKRFAFYNDQFYFKTGEEMSKVFHDLPEAIDNTNEIVDKVELLSLERELLLPHFVIPPNFKTQDEYLTSITWAGANKRYKILTPQIEERIQFELSIIEKMGFSGYFLIVSDFIRAGKELGVFIGPGRGSAAGSVVAYCIGITNIDPIKYDLLFERFLNPERKSMPDIDTDFDDEGREKVIDYVVKKYGQNQVAQIVTFGTMAAKSAIADVARVMDLPLSESRAITKLLPDRLNIRLETLFNNPLTKADITKNDEQKSDVFEKSVLTEKYDISPGDLENIKTLRNYYNSDTLAGNVLKEAQRLEGSVRNTGIHASAIIIAPKDITEILPVAASKDSKLYITQIEGNSIESAGVIKMDFLGLRTLSVLKTALKLIKQNHGVEINLDEVPLDDEATYKVFQAGDTAGFFQFESTGMQKALRELKPDKFEDLIAMNALYRPGPMQYIASFAARKHGKEEVTYDLEDMKEYLESTFGITVYQEQVMLIAQKISGFSKGRADELRKAIGKKDAKKLASLKDEFISGGEAKGHPAEVLKKIWADWESFASYAFNKSHATCYAFVAFQTAYLKAHYPSEFMAALLNHADNTEKITFYMEECKRVRLNVLGPDINESFFGFAVNKKGEIRFGLGGIKGVGEAAIDQIIEERTKNGHFTSIFDLAKRVNTKAINKKTMECLAYSGAFDSFGEFHRAQYFFALPGEPSGLEKIIRYGTNIQSQASSSANTLFGEILDSIEPEKPKIAQCDEWPLMELLEHEKSVIGIYISGHPLGNYNFELKHYHFTPLAKYNEYKQAADSQEKVPTHKIRLAGLVTSAQIRMSKKGNYFTLLTIEDYNQKSEFLLFGEDHLRFQTYCKPGIIIMIEGNFNSRFNNAKYQFNISKMQLLENIKQDYTEQISMDISSNDIDEELLNFLKKNFNQNPGETKVKLHITSPYNEKYHITLYTLTNGITLNEELIQFLIYRPSIDVNVQLN